jgi:hypothetical protein
MKRPPCQGGKVAVLLLGYLRASGIAFFPCPVPPGIVFGWPQSFHLLSPSQNTWLAQKPIPTTLLSYQSTLFCQLSKAGRSIPCQLRGLFGCDPLGWIEVISHSFSPLLLPLPVLPVF